MKSRRRRKIDRLLQQRNIAETLVDEVSGNGRLVKIRVRRRITHPFESLYTAGSLSREDRAAAYDLIGLHARSRGLAGRPDDELGVVVHSLSDPHVERLRMAKYGVAFGEVMARLDPWPGRLLRALIVDFVEGDGASGTGDGARWRGIVRAAAQDWNRRLKVAQAAGNLAGVDGAHRIDIRESEAGQVVARAVRAAATQGDGVVALAEVLEATRAWVKKARPQMVRYFYVC